MGLGVKDLSLRFLRGDPDLERVLRRESLDFSTDERVFLFSLSFSVVSRSELRFSLDFALVSFNIVSPFFKLLLLERDADFLLFLERSAPLLEDDDELDDVLLELLELDLDPELRDELLSEELKVHKYHLLIETLMFLGYENKSIAKIFNTLI